MGIEEPTDTRTGARAWVSRHKRAVAAALAGALAVVVFVVVWFQPQKLFIDVGVDEAIPTQGAPGAAETVQTEAMGEFVPLGHEASGRAVVIRTDGTRLVRFEDFRVENGPDLVVYLSTAPPDAADDDAFADDFVDLGQLKGNVGNQNYEIP
ncbi:MAG: DM13 domain-containing protein, partial [Candidatus Binatia bacterium]